MMKENNLQKKYSLRKFKGIGLASAVIGVLFANQSVYAGVTSGDKSETTVITGADNERVTEKIPASHRTTFTDDKDSTKKVTVDAVIGNVTFEPKANEHFGNPDGTDRVNFSKKATVNYLLEENHSKITESKIYEEKGNVYANYDKKGISYDTDGKAYRGSGVEIIRGEINENTGSEFHLKANNKAYQLVRSEVVDKEKAVYEKSHFNDIEASVSPEGMYNYLGEINYGKITGKVYLVEETSDGHYGKYVKASNINSDEEAVNAWKNGQNTAKDFTKENVTLQEGDTILVMDRDTYAHGSGGRKVHTTDYRREKIAATPEFNKLASSEEISNVNGYPTYAFGNEILNDKFSTIGKDGVFGTSDDGEVDFKNEEHLRYERNWKIGNQFPEMTDIPDVDFRKLSVNEILRYMQSEVYGILEYFDHYAKTDAERKDIQERRSRLDQNIADTAEMIKNENIDIAAQSWRLAFLSPDKEKLTALRKHIESGEKVLDELLLTLKTDEENVEQYENHKNVKKITKKVLLYELNHKDIYGYRYDYPKFSYRTLISYHKDAVPEHYSDWKKDDGREEREVFVYTNKGVVTISDDLKHINVVDENKTTTETEFTKQEVTTTKETDYEVKELITPVRAYKVMGDGSPIVNHYYRIQITRESEAYSMKAVGGVRIKYITNEGKELKTEIVREVGDIYELNVYNQYSGNTKVGERRVENRIDADYDTTVKQYPTLKDAKTGFTYEYVGLKQGSPAASGKVVAGITEVIYEYRLVSEEEKTPSKTVETKGSVVVKYVDANGNEIKDAEKVVTDAVVKTKKTYTTKSVDVVVSTRDEVENHEVQYNTAGKKVETITKDGKKYNYYGIYAVSDKFNNTTAETGKVVEGTTTVVYQYALEPNKVEWAVSENPPVLEMPEFTGGTSMPEAPINEVPEFKGGTSVPEAPIHDIPEFTGGVVAIEPPIYTKPTLIITKWVDEDGVQLRPADVKEPVELGQPNEAFEHGTIEGYESIGTIRNQEGDVVTHRFRKLNVESKESNNSRGNSENEEQKNEKIILETPKNKDISKMQKSSEEITNEKSMDETLDSTSDESLASTSVSLPQASQLPQTGTGDELAFVSAATSALLVGVGIARPRKKQ